MHVDFICAQAPVDGIEQRINALPCHGRYGNRGVPAALRGVAKGGRVVCAGIHMSDIPSFPYAILWGERTLRSVANLTRRDGEDFLALAPRVPVRTHTEALPLAQANEALARLRDGRLDGAAVLVTGEGGA